MPVIGQGSAGAVTSVTSFRVLQGTQAVVTLEWYDQNEELTDASGDVTVDVTRWDGTEVRSDVAATREDVGLYTFDLLSSETAELDELTIVGTDSAGVSRSMTVEIVGGFWFSVTAARNSDSNLADPNDYPSADIIAMRAEVEDEAERIIGAAFVPRFKVVTLHGQGTNELSLPSWHVRRIRGISVDGTALSDSIVEAAALRTRTLVRPDSWFPLGTANVTVALEHGRDTPPTDLKKAAITRLRTRLNAERSGIPDRATSWSAAEGGTFAIATPGKGDWKTGIPDVDSVYLEYASAYRSDLVSVPLY